MGSLSPVQFCCFGNAAFLLKPYDLIHLLRKLIHSIWKLIHFVRNFIHLVRKLIHLIRKLIHLVWILLLHDAVTLNWLQKCSSLLQITFLNLCGAKQKLQAPLSRSWSRRRAEAEGWRQAEMKVSPNRSWGWRQAEVEGGAKPKLRKVPSRSWRSLQAAAEGWLQAEMKVKPNRGSGFHPRSRSWRVVPSGDEGEAT